MHTDVIRKQIRLAWDDEARSGAFANLIRRQLDRAGVSPDADAATDGDILASWRAQLELVPDLLDELRNAAAQAGVSEQVEPVVQAAESYFLDPDDVLPDSHGVLGLLDDMYLALSLIHAVSEEQRLRAGQPLLDTDLTDLIDAVRPLFMGTRRAALNDLIERALGRPEIAQSVKQLAGMGCVLNVRSRQPA
jgi:uncharacterized membrane protein YkvA (DUF1232 family)